MTYYDILIDRIPEVIGACRVQAGIKVTYQGHDHVNRERVVTYPLADDADLLVRHVRDMIRDDSRRANHQ